MDARINRNGSFTTLQLSQMKAIKAGVRDGLVITYKKIKNHITGKALDSRNVAQGSIVSQYNPSAISPNLEWQVILLGNGYYKIKNHANGMVLDGSGWFWMVLDGSGLTTDGATLYQNADITHSNLEWSLE